MINMQSKTSAGVSDRDASARERHIKTRNATQQRYSFKFSFESNECWRASGTLEAEEKLPRQKRDPHERTLDLTVGLREVVAIFRARKSAGEWRYMYFGSRRTSFQPSPRKSITSILRSRASTNLKSDSHPVYCSERSAIPMITC